MRMYFFKLGIYLLALLLSFPAWANDNISSRSYKLAGIHFLPELIEKDIEYNTGLSNPNQKPDGCEAYTLSSCPTGGFCSPCPTNAAKYKLDNCNAEQAYKKVGNQCIKKTCSELNSSYLSSIPLGQICTKFTEKTLTCYKSCRNVQCSGYTLSCSRLPTNATALKKCTDCQSTSANCSDNSCLVSSCSSLYKVNESGTACVLKDDTCPDGYYKECETGTIGSPEYTEMGTACYQCKAVETCEPSKYYWNGNGNYNVASGQNAINLYGGNNTTTIPSSGSTVCYAGWTFANGATVNGGNLVITGNTEIGVHGGGVRTNVTFNTPVVSNGKIILYNNSWLVFKKGISGSYACYDGNSNSIECPFTNTCDISGNYVNQNGAYSVSSSQAAINLYGSNNTTTIPSSGAKVCYAGWTFSGGATVSGGPLIIYGTLEAGVHGGNVKTPLTFDIPVYINGKISIYKDSELTFNRGLGGEYECYKNGSTLITCPFTPKCDKGSYYYNGNGTYTVKTTDAAINLYGSSMTTNLPSSGANVCYAGWTFASGATVNGGPLNIVGDLELGAHGGGVKTSVKFNVPVKVYGKIILHKSSTVSFKSGISGKYTCYDGNGNKITCGF